MITLIFPRWRGWGGRSGGGCNVQHAPILRPTRHDTHTLQHLRPLWVLQRTGQDVTLTAFCQWRPQDVTFTAFYQWRPRMTETLKFRLDQFFTKNKLVRDKITIFECPGVPLISWFPTWCLTINLTWNCLLIGCCWVILITPSLL